MIIQPKPKVFHRWKIKFVLKPNTTHPEDRQQSSMQGQSKIVKSFTFLAALFSLISTHVIRSKTMVIRIWVMAKSDQIYMGTPYSKFVKLRGASFVKRATGLKHNKKWKKQWTESSVLQFRTYPIHRTTFNGFWVKNLGTGAKFCNILLCW